MAKYNTDDRDLQAVNTVKNDKHQQTATRIYCDLDTGEAVEGLVDSKFPWRQRKQRTLELATLYRAAQLGGKADKVVSCSTWLQYLATFDGNRQLHHYNACKNRLCPVCNKRRAKQMATRLVKVLHKVQADHDGTQLIFLTLTLENCTGDKLRETLDLLTTAWFKLIRRRSIVRAVRGWFRALEITYNKGDDTYHPHIHAVLVVEDAYFAKRGKLYIKQADWVRMWRESLQVDYNPIVGIQATYGKSKGQRPGKMTGKAAAAAIEAAKYATKDGDYLDSRLPKAKAAEVVATYDAALHRKRLTAMGGWVKEAAAQLALDVEDDGDLVHDVDGAGELTSETAQLLEDYGWHFGVSDHVLLARYANPEYNGGMQDGLQGHSRLEAGGALRQSDGNNQTDGTPGPEV